MFKNIRDKWLVQQFLFFRSEAAFNQLYKAHHLPLYRMAVQMTGGNSLLAEELVQETWLRAVENLENFKGKSELRTWFIAILINCFREHLRKQQHHEFIDESIMETKVQEAMGTNRMDIQKALSVLPPGYRIVIMLHDVEGYKHAEIARLLSISEGTSKSQLFNARKTLKQYLQ